MCTGADCILKDNALSQAVSHFDNDVVVAVGGRLLVAKEDGSLLEEAQCCEYMITFQIARRILDKLKAQCLISGAFGVFRKSVLLQMNGYDTDTVGKIWNWSFDYWMEDKVVTTVMSNFGLYKAFDELGIGYEKTKVGDKYVYENMKENGYNIGGEQSGHIIFSKYASTGDGILTSLKMMQVMIGRKKKMSELSDGFTMYPQVLENVRVADKKAAQANA